MAEGFAHLAHHFGPDALVHELMARHTTIRIGGPADIYVVAYNTDDLVRFVRTARSLGVPILLIGDGANILVADAGIRGVVIENRAQAVTIRELADGYLVRADAGVPLSELARYCCQRGMAGLEWAVDVPGSVGGSVVGNAGAYGGYMDQVVITATILTPQGDVCTLTHEEIGFGYRTSKLKEEHGRQEERTVVLSAELVLRRGDPRELMAKAAGYTHRRWDRQPREPSAGSIFKRTQDYPAGFLIEQAGLKGLRLNQAQISSQHANVIVNLGGARAQDVKTLAMIAQAMVHQLFGIDLEMEIELVGDWPPEPSGPPPRPPQPGA